VADNAFNRFLAVGVFVRGNRNLLELRSLVWKKK